MLNVVPSAKMTPKRRTALGLHDIALEDGIADIESHRDTVANGHSATLQRRDAPDLLRSARGRSCLRVLAWRQWAGERGDDVSCQRRAVRSKQSGKPIGFEIIRDDDGLAVVTGDFQTVARPLEVAAEKQMSVGNRDEFPACAIEDGVKGSIVPLQICAATVHRPLLLKRCTLVGVNA